jgi:phosphoglycerate-specific signal transduction histidine kinase
MTNHELHQSWKRTEAYLLDARAHLSQLAEAEYTDEIDEFEHFVENNELGLAFDTLESIANESQWEVLRVLELLALAAASMELLDRRDTLDKTITELRGWEYKTNLPPDSES